jgi:hypothetical protein
MLLEINKLRVESIVPVSFEPTQQEFNLDRANVLSLSNFETFFIKNKLCEEPEVAFLLGWLERYWHNTFRRMLLEIN